MIKAYGLYNETTKKGDVILLDKDGKKTNEVGKAVTARVKHYRLANSYNNRNVVGELITVYSSQTTAHILDAIKEGSIFNENEFTFGTFKTLIDTGMDYRTAIAFLMQPAITTINEVIMKVIVYILQEVVILFRKLLRELLLKLVLNLVLLILLTILTMNRYC